MSMKCLHITSPSFKYFKNVHQRHTFAIIDLLRNPGSIDFQGFLSQFSILFWGVISNVRILPLKKESKIGQKSSANRRTLGYAKGLMKKIPFED